MFGDGVSFCVLAVGLSGDSSVRTQQPEQKLWEGSFSTVLAGAAHTPGANCSSLLVILIINQNLELKINLVANLSANR